MGGKKSFMNTITPFDFEGDFPSPYTSTMPLRREAIWRHLSAFTVGCMIALSACVSAFGQTLASHESPQARELPLNASNNCESDGSTSDGKRESGTNLSLAERCVAERLTVWQQRLKLEEWRISVVMTRRGDLKPKTLGGIRWDKPKKTAVIWVLDPSDYRLPPREMLDDIELTIVHELVHLKLASLPRSEASRSSEEHAVNGIAEALLGLDRNKQ
jgi:hypothetical protein